MPHLKTLLIFILTIIIFIMPNIVLSSDTIIPRKILFGNPDKSLVRLSPDGKYISYIAPSDAGVLNIWIANSSTPLEGRLITHDMGRGIRSYMWCYDNNHILYMQDEKGDENFRIYSYDIKSNKSTLITPSRGVRASIAGASINKPSEVLISTNERNKSFFDLYKYDLNTGKLELFFKNEKFSNMIVDKNLNLRIASLQNSEADDEYFILKNGIFEPMMVVNSEDSSNTGILGFDKTGDNVYILDSRNRNTAALKILNLDTMKYKMLAQNKKADVGIFAMHPVELTIQAVCYEYEKTHYKVLDHTIKDDFHYLMNLEHGEFGIISRTMDDNFWLVAYQSDIGPVKYYKYDYKNKSAEYLFNNREILTKYDLAPMHPVIIKSRDGLNLVSYLTVPNTAVKKANGIDTKSPIPMVLLVHGGPWARDSWGLNASHQWLANRGYAVLSVNFRGSTGFGKEFANAGNLQWAKKMHDDLLDAVNWAVSKKIADPKKIAIMGGSYGGYATLVGLTMTPDVFACGIDIVGPSSIMTLINSVPPYWKPILNDFKKRIGPWDTKEQIEALNQISPLYFVDNITKPLLIAQGAHDPRVKQAESDQIVNAMRKKSIPVIYSLYHEEGHGFAKPENRLSFYSIAESFLSNVLGGKKEDIGDDLKGANFDLNGKKVLSPNSADKIIDEMTK